MPDCAIIAPQRLKSLTKSSLPHNQAELPIEIIFTNQVFIENQLNMEHQPLLNENVKNDKPNMRRNFLVSLVVAVSVIGTGLVIADKAGYFTTVTTYNPSFRASDGMVSVDATKKADMGGPANPMSSQIAPVAPGMEVMQGVSPPLAGTPSSGKTVPVPSSTTGAAVAKQAGVAKTPINGGVAIDYITKTDGGKGPQPGDVTTPSWVDLDTSSSANSLVAPTAAIKGTKTTTTTGLVPPTTTKSASKDKDASNKSATTTAVVSTKATKTAKSAGDNRI